MIFLPVMGLEIHAELLTKSKLFCSCENTFGGVPNSCTCPVCTGQPGSLPILNQEAVALAAKAGFVMNSVVHQQSCFDRKNYFYPDLPKAYQITQLYSPICTGGNIGKIRINNIHIEEDAGKLIHKDDISEIDLNRCGVPLIEIVTEPDFTNSDEICEFLDELSKRLKFAGICDAKMEQGSLRVDVNISLMKPEDTKLGVRAELKNINSFRSIRRAVDFEIKRQSKILSSGGTIIQETRRFDENKGITVLMRSKEQASDYRYFPEPDIPPIFIPEEVLCKLKSEIPELPSARFLRYTNEFKLSENDAFILSGDKDFSDFFDSCVKISNNPEKCAKLMLGEFSHRLKLSDSNILNLKFSPKAFSELIALEANGIVNKNEEKEILKIMFESGRTPEEILKDIKKEISEEQIKAKIFELLAENEKLAEEYKNGSQKCVDFFIGQIIRTFGKSANPKLCREMIIDILKTV